MSLNILVVDDDKSLLEFVKSMLLNEGFEVDSAENTKDAMEKISTAEYSIIISDKNMPGDTGNNEGGMDILRHIKNKSPFTGVIMMTGYATVESAIEAMKLGASDYIIKPFKIKELIKKIKRLAEYQKHISPETTAPIYDAFHKDLLDFFGDKTQLDEDKKHKLLDNYQDCIGKFFEALKQREKIILKQRDALSNIEMYAEQLREKLKVNDPVYNFIEKIVKESQNRI